MLTRKALISIFSAGYVPDPVVRKRLGLRDFFTPGSEKSSRLDEIVETPDQKVELD
jgi:hypothetical protein